MDSTLIARPHLSKVAIADYLLGPVDPNKFIAGIIMAIFGMWIITKIDINRRDKESKFTPPEWSWKFFFKDTVGRLLSSFLTNIAVVAVFIRFTGELLGMPLSMFICLIIGAGIDYATIMLRNVVKNARYTVLKGTDITKDSDS